MLSLGPLAFAAPWALAALLALPAIWWLLRITPPSPRIVAFPAFRLLRDLITREETAARTPWWLLLLRLAILALVILALAQPILNPATRLPGSGPLLIVLDNGWAAARDWPLRLETATQLLDQAAREDRPVYLLATAQGESDEAVRLAGPLRAEDARQFMETVQPSPWSADREAAQAALTAAALPANAHAVWLSDGLDTPGAAALGQALGRFAATRVFGADGALDTLVLLPPAPGASGLTSPVLRPQTRGEQAVAALAFGDDGRPLGRAAGRFAEGDARIELAFDMPPDRAREVVRIALENQATAGGTVLIDERWRRRPVGIVSGRGEGYEQPLLSDLYYLERALEPFSDVRRGSIESLFDSGEISLVILADVGGLTETEAERMRTWIEKGGVVLRFAGPRMAQGVDALLPVKLRGGDRSLGGALSWTEPARLAPFPDTSPFAGLAVPPDVLVERQVLAEPAPDLEAKSWARLRDGTPLVTAERRGAGHLVLVHTTAAPEWSNLALSGLFVEMLRRTVALAAGIAASDTATLLEPLRALDPRGQIGAMGPAARPLAANAFAQTKPGPLHPAGFYGKADDQRALNLSPKLEKPALLAPLVTGLDAEAYGTRGETPLTAGLLTAALLLAVLDTLIALALRGLLPRPRLARATTALGAILTSLHLFASAPAAAADDERAAKAATGTFLAYVETGDAALDAVSRAGLEGLSRVLADRTAVDAKGALGVDPETDELAFYPLLYWPIDEAQAAPSDAAIARLNTYLRAGGMILFDTRDIATGGSGGIETLRRLARGLDVPPLAPAGPDHVIARAFYLLQDFPGRNTGAELWVESRESERNDGVSSIVIGGNDFAAAWAIDENGRPMFPVQPGGERQRELAYRFGVNLVMYALTGNYKADQVHVPFILERLGQ
jgi:hypothetical protein